MKRLLAVSVLVFVALACVGQEIIYNANPTLEWNAVTQGVDLTPIVLPDYVEYEVLRADPGAHTNQASLGVVSSTSMLLTVSGGPWAHGVRSILTTDGGVTVLYSTITWSDVEGTPSPFLYKSPATVLPERPTGLRTQ